MANSGKFLYAGSGMHSCVPLYTNTDCFSCMYGYTGYLTINCGNKTYYIPYGTSRYISTNGRGYSCFIFNKGNTVYYTPHCRFCYYTTQSGTYNGACNCYGCSGFTLYWYDNSKWCTYNSVNSVTAGWNQNTLVSSPSRTCDYNSNDDYKPRYNDSKSLSSSGSCNYSSSYAYACFCNGNKTTGSLKSSLNICGATSEKAGRISTYTYSSAGYKPSYSGATPGGVSACVCLRCVLLYRMYWSYSRTTVTCY